MAFPKYADFYRHFGVRRPMQMAAPTLTSLSRFALPKESILHVLPTGTALGPPADDLMFQGFIGPIYVEHLTKLEDDRGRPRSSMLSYSKMIREYHRKNRHLRQLTNIDRALKDPRTMIVVNYGLLPQLFRYPTNVYRSYSKWWNLTSTMVHHIVDLGTKSDRQQFLECKLPTMLPSRAMLSKGQGKLTPRLMSLFPDSESLFLLELWKWLGPLRPASMLARIPPATLAKLNFVWICGERFFVFNMGLLNDWRQPAEGEKDDRLNPKNGLMPMVLQNRFLRLLMFLQESQTAMGGEAKPLETDEVHDEAEVKDLAEAKPVEIQVPDEDGDNGLTLKLTIDMSLKDLPLDDVEETKENIELIDKLIEKDLAVLDQLQAEREASVAHDILTEGEEIERLLDTRSLDRADDESPSTAPPLEDLSLKDAIVAKADQLASMDLLSAAEYRRLQALSDAYTKLPDPYGIAKNLAEAVKIDTKDLSVNAVTLIDHMPGVMDKSMLHSTLSDLDQKYVKEVLHKDVGNAVLHIQKGGIAVTGYQVEEHRDAVDHYVKHSVQLTPVKGRAATIHFRLPKVDENGVWAGRGVKYRLARQWRDVPLRKVNPTTVALTSYYGKTFVTRSEKKVANWAEWIIREVKVRGVDPSDTSVVDMMLADVYDPNTHVPRIYSTLARAFRSFTMGPNQFFFDYEARQTLFPETNLSTLEGKHFVLAGRQGKTTPIVVGDDNVFYAIKGDDVTPIGSMEDLLGLETSKRPREVAEIKIGGKLIPVGIFLSFQLGFSGMLKLLNVKPNRTLMTGEQARLAADEYLIAFEDERLVFTAGHDAASLILQGLATYNDILMNYARFHYEKRAIYYNVMERQRLGVRIIREMELMADMFVDHITKEILESRHEPTTFVGLVLKACELLTTDWSPDEVDTEYQRLVGYERFAGAVYAELVRAVRQHRARGSANVPLEVNPNAIWNAVTGDSANRLVEESNPVHELKGVEEVTYSGTGGRSGRSMVGRTRLFHPNDLGIISEATKDSGDVAITTFTTANPQVTDLRGMTRRYDRKTTGAASLISTSALLAPAATYDQARRVGFIGIQNSSTTHVKHQRPSPIRTGYEKIIGLRTSDLYHTAAQRDGEITKVNRHAIEVTYKDGSVKAVELGRRFGSVENIKIPHDIVTHLKVGDKVKRGDTVAYNTLFFEPDPLDTKHALWKQGVLLNVAFMEMKETLEDSCAISQEAARLLETQMTKVRDIVVTKDQAVHDVLPVGTVVEVNSILCTLEDPITADQSVFDDSSMSTLKLLAAHNPKAKISGTVEKIEVFYNVADIEDLSASLQDIAHASDLERKRKAKELHLPYASGKVTDDLRLDGDPLLAGTVAIRFYITVDVAQGVGDKLVLGNQLKSVVGKVMDGVNETVEGEAIDMIFSYAGVDNRLTLSTPLMGTTNVLLELIGKKAAELYLAPK
jgi:hypothetical protein